MLELGDVRKDVRGHRPPQPMTRRSLFKSHLYGQIVVPLIFASVGLAVVASIVAVYFLQDLTSKWVSQVAEATTTGVVQRFIQYGGEMHVIAKTLAEDDTVQELVADGEPAALNAELSSQTALWPRGSVAVLNARGVVVASAGEDAPPLGRSLRGSPSASTLSSAATAVVVTSGTQAQLLVTEPIGTAGAGRVVVIQSIDDALMARLADGANGGFCFYTSDGKRVACAVSGTFISGSGDALERALGSPGEALRTALEGASSSAQGQATLTVGQEKYRINARALRYSGAQGDVGGYVVGSVSQAVSDQAAQTSMNLIFIWSGIAILALVGLGFWVARRVSTPLAELADGARRIADGDFTTKVHVHGENEIAVLGQTFNDMTDSLRERSESLTKKVLELATLYEMSRALGSTLDLDELLGSTLDSALRIFDLDVGYVALRDRDSGALEIRAVRGEDLPLERKGADVVSSSMAEWVVREGRPLIFNPDPGSAEDRVDVLTGAKAALCVPLVSAEGTIGAITVGSSDAAYRFNSDDVRLLSTIGNHVTIAIGNIELFISLQEAYLATVRSLAAAVDAKDTYTRGHSDKVATYATLMAQRMNLSHEQIIALEMAAYLHDIGKIGVPEAILLKPGRLSDDEMAQMRHHPLIGANILKPVAFPWAITPIVRHHHEYFDGSGYPAGLAGDEIPLLARVLCVADSYEAMTADRPYRAGRCAADAVVELQRCSGTQFDPRVVEIMTEVVEDLERTGRGVLRDTTEEISAEEARAIFAALVDGVMGSFRRLGGPRLASNVEAEVDEYLAERKLPYRMVRGRLTFHEDAPEGFDWELGGMRDTLRHVEEIMARVSGGTLVEHFYEDAVDGFSVRMRKLASMLEFRDEQ
jgi:putative nucleotidyltransferase with HDIG domain